MLVKLAEELSMDGLDLHLGIFILNGENTPKVSTILQNCHLPGFPEAHCYLTYRNQKIDITFPENITASMSYEMIQEISITPDQIGNFKINWHRQIINGWLLKNNSTYTLDEIWRIREMCIEMLF